ncbi:hypothetical protein [Pseudomonas sp. NPDC079086]|uniref:hypothetical protein n=1 Tax=unclassified Pseudomonas TaxID=196821 RepID=UPI0037CAEAF4
MKRLQAILVALLSCVYASSGNAKYATTTINVSGNITSTKNNVGGNAIKIEHDGTCENAVAGDCQNRKENYVFKIGGGGSTSILQSPPISLNETLSLPYFMMQNPRRDIEMRNENGDSFHLTLDITDVGGRFYFGHLHNFVKETFYSYNIFRSPTCKSKAASLKWGDVRELYTFSQPGCSTSVAEAKPGAVISIWSMSEMYLGTRFVVLETAGIKAGRYNGVVKFNVGPNPADDIYIGEKKSYSQTVIFNIVLTVEHQLKVEPLTGTRVALQPKGGWQSWLFSNRAPTLLSADSTFSLSTNSNFKMRLKCQYPGTNNNCALQSARDSTKKVTVKTLVSLPVGISANGQAVHRSALSSNMGDSVFIPSSYTAARNGTLHFEMAEDQVSSMLNDGENIARRYSGNITVVWEVAI